MLAITSIVLSIRLLLVSLTGRRITTAVLILALAVWEGWLGVGVEHARALALARDDEEGDDD